jgi:hypothetical protein
VLRVNPRRIEDPKKANNHSKKGDLSLFPGNLPVTMRIAGKMRKTRLNLAPVRSGLTLRNPNSTAG